LIALVALGAYLVITAVGEVYKISWLVYPKYIFDPPYNEFEGRARGPYLNPVANGLAICLAILSAVYLFKAAPRRWWPLLIVLSLAFLGTIYLTQTRCVWLGGMTAIGILFIVRIPREKRVATVVYFSLLGLVVVASQWESLLSFKRDKELTAEETRKSAELRPILATMAWKMFKDHPLDGVGLSQYDENSERYLKKIEYGLPLEEARGYTQHNVFLSLLTETGLIGMAMFIAILTFWSYHALKLYNAADRPDWIRYQGLFCLAFLGAYLPNAMFQDVSQIAMVNMFLFFVAGLTMNFRLRQEEVRSVKLEV
jgi:O-antigen ligase